MEESKEFESVSQKLAAETAKIRWHELQRFFAQGAVLWVDSSLDLVKVASYFADDNTQKLEPLLDTLLVRQPTNSQARQWYNDDALLWSVVVAPYVLVQDQSQK